MDKANRLTVDVQDSSEFARQVYEAARKGELPTWRVDDQKNGRFTHSTDQWEGRAWLAISFPDKDHVQFKLERPDGEQQYDKDVRGVYLGRFVEMLVNRFGKDISSIEVDRR